MLFKTTSTNKNDLSGRARLIPGNPPPESKKKSAVKPSSIQRAKQVAQEKFSKFTGFFGKKIFSTTSNKKRSGADSELSPLNSGQSSPGSIGELDDFNDETSTCSDMSEKENCSDENQAIISSSISTFSLKKAKEIKYIKDLPQPALTPFQKKMSDHLFNYINDYRQIESFLNNGAYVNAKQAGSGDTMLHLVLNEKLKIKKDFTDLYKKSSPSENPSPNKIKIRMTPSSGILIKNTTY